MNRMQRRTLWISIVGVLLVTAYAALAAVQILVLNTLAAAPGLTLDEIGSAMSDAGEGLGEGAVFAILGIGVALALATAVVCIARRAHPVVPAMTFLALLMCGTIGYFVASFGAGMALADTFGISGGDYSPWAQPLYAISVLAALALVVGAIATAARRRPSVASA